LNTLLPVIVGFILTGIIGNWLVHRWQSRSWLAQQRFSGNEKEYHALKDLADEIAMLLGERIYITQRLLLCMKNTDTEKFTARLADYDDVVKRWNIRLTSFYVRLSLLTDEGFSISLERKIQQRLVEVGNTISKFIGLEKRNIDKQELIRINELLIAVQAAATNFNRRLLNAVLNRKKVLYEGEIFKFSVENLDKFSTWFLFKAIFARDVNSLAVVRSTLDF
jgi:hypothetical protein